MPWADALLKRLVFQTFPSEKRICGKSFLQLRAPIQKPKGIQDSLPLKNCHSERYYFAI